MKTAVIYARVSSEGDRQNTDRQVADLRSYAADTGFDVVRVFTDIASGGAMDERPVLAECLDWCCAGNADILLLSGISDLGRSAAPITDAVNRLTKAGVCAYFHDTDVSTLLPSGKERPYATMLVTMLGLGAKLERKLIMGRLNGGRKHAMENGIKMGRKPGSRKPKEKKEKEYAQVISLLKEGTSIRKTAELCGVSAKTVQAVKKEFVDSDKR